MKGRPFACYSLLVIFIMWLIIYAITFSFHSSHPHTSTSQSMHKNRQSFKRKGGAHKEHTRAHTRLHTHIVPDVAVMREFVVLGWQCTHRLSSGDRLSVKNEQFWLSISANLYICMQMRQCVTKPHARTNVHRHTKEKNRIEFMRHSERKLKARFFKSYTKVKQSVQLINSVNRTCGLCWSWAASCLWTSFLQSGRNSPCHQVQHWNKPTSRKARNLLKCCKTLPACRLWNSFSSAVLFSRTTDSDSLC